MFIQYKRHILQDKTMQLTTQSACGHNIGVGVINLHNANNKVWMYINSSILSI